MKLTSDPGALVPRQLEHVRGDLAVAEVRDRDMLEDAAQGGADGDPDLAELLRVPGYLVCSGAWSWMFARGPSTARITLARVISSGGWASRSRRGRRGVPAPGGRA